MKKIYYSLFFISWIGVVLFAWQKTHPPQPEIWIEADTFLLSNQNRYQFGNGEVSNIQKRYKSFWGLKKNLIDLQKNWPEPNQEKIFTDLKIQAWSDQIAQITFANKRFIVFRQNTDIDWAKINQIPVSKKNDFWILQSDKNITELMQKIPLPKNGFIRLQPRKPSDKFIPPQKPVYPPGTRIILDQKIQIFKR